MTNISSCGCISIVLIFIILPHCIADSSNIKLHIYPRGSNARVISCKVSPPSDKKITWERLPCIESFDNVNNCRKTENWTTLAETGRKLTLTNTNESHNGFYRCLHNNQVVKTFYVEIAGLEPIKNAPKVESLTWTASNNPDFVEYTFHCNITSEIEPAVMWVKQCHGSTCNLLYENKCYCPMNGIDNEPFNTIHNTYLSKFKLNNVREVDSGWYGCAAVTLYGKDMKNVTIKVNPVKLANLSPYTLLFLIPFAFILTPAIIWLCYYWNRRKTRVKHQKQRLIQPILARS